MKKRIVGKEMVVVMAIMGMGILAMSLLGPIMPLYLTSIGITPEILGLMFSVATIGMIAGEGSWGWVADKVGLKIPLSVGTFVCGLLVPSIVLTQNVPSIFTIFFFWGIARSAIFGPGRGYIGANAPLLKKATFMAVVAVMMSGARSIGALPSGFIVDNWGYNYIFFISSAVSILGGIVVVAGLRKTQTVKPVPPDASSPPTDELSSPDRTFSYRSLSFQGAVAFLQFFGMGISMTFLPLLATQVVGMTATEVGFLFTIQGVVSMMIGIPLGMLADRKGKRVFMIIGLLVSGAATAGIALAENFPWLIVFTIIRSLGMAMFSPAAVGLLSDSVPRHRQGTAMGFYGAFAEDTGVIAGSALGGVIWSAWGPRATFLMGTVAAVLGAVVCFGWVREKTPKNHLPE
jgi:PPP family 3-phenylpropionic acid transporter